MTTPFHSPALRFQLDFYPKAWRGRVPKRVKLLKASNQECDVYVSASGLVTALLDSGVERQLDQADFEVIAWHDQ